MNITNKNFFDKLRVDEVFDFYDMPRLFSCKAPAGQTYLALNIGEDENSATWLYVAVSEMRLGEAKRGQKDMRRIFLNAEDGMVYKLRSFTDLREHQVKALSIQQIDEIDLPEAGALLNETESEEDCTPLLSADDEWQMLSYASLDQKHMHAGNLKSPTDEAGICGAGEETLAWAA